MEVTTIKLHERTKAALDRVRLERESYDDTVQRLLSLQRKKELTEQLIEAYRAAEHLEEWDNATAPWPM